MNIVVHALSRSFNISKNHLHSINKFNKCLPIVSIQKTSSFSSSARSYRRVLTRDDVTYSSNISSSEHNRALFKNNTSPIIIRGITTAATSAFTTNHTSALPPKRQNMDNLNSSSNSGDIPIVQFKDLVSEGKLSQMLLTGHSHETCTDIQAQTMDPILAGEDVLARAKTGTGKTLAFLLPAIQRHIIEANPLHGNPTILVLSPTRELAMQIEKEAQKMFAGITGYPRHSQVVVGGTNIMSETQRLKTGRCDLLVATPGRLLDHLNNHNLASKFQHLRCLVLDEADRLLDQGFRRDLEKIAKFIPVATSDGNPRQTLLFSATISSEVKEIAKIYLRSESECRFISTVKESEESTHSHVTQEYMIAEVEDHLPILASIIERSVATDPKTKIMCFFPTAKATALAASTFATLKLPIPFFEIHSRKTQAARLTATNGFTKASSGVLLSSDVTARGIDIPGVTSVIQVSMPSNGEQYVHRLGRTARAGNEGKGLLILAPWEKRFLLNKDIMQLPLTQVEARQSEGTDNLVRWKDRINAAMEKVDEKLRAGAYQAFLGYYASMLRSMGLSAPSLILLANTYAKSVLRWQLTVEGKAGLPPIPKKVVGKMSLDRNALKDLNLVSQMPWETAKPPRRVMTGGIKA